MKLDIAFKLRAGVWLDDRSGAYVAWVPSLDIYSQGRTAGEARIAVEDAAFLYIKHCYHRTIIDDLLVGRGFEPTDGDLDPDGDDEFIEVRRVNPEFDRFDFQVPLDLIQGARVGRGDGAGTCQS